MINRLDLYKEKFRKLGLREDKITDLINEFKDTDLFYQDLALKNYPDRLDYNYDHEFVNALTFDDNLIQLMIEWAYKLKRPFVIVSLLSLSKKKYDGSFLKDIFHKIDTSNIWRFCSKIEQNPPYNINEWIKELYLDKSLVNETTLLALVIIKIYSKDEAISILKKGFDLHPGITAEALSKIVKDKESLMFLDSKLKNYPESSLAFKEIKKAISKIIKKVNNDKNNSNISFK